MQRGSEPIEQTFTACQGDTGVQSTPDFESWVDALFTRSQKDEYWQRCQLSGEELADYLARLFESPASLGDKYPRQQLADGIWLICGCVMGFFHSAMDSSVPDSARHRWIRAIGTLYTDLFDPLCASVPPELQDDDPFCSAVYMLWDMDSLSYAQTFPQLIDECLRILHVALGCKSDACIKSGLHGLGHWYSWAEYESDGHLARRITNMIDDFLRTHEALSSDLFEYATAARTGSIQ
jgi:hypothetical protein